MDLKTTTTLLISVMLAVAGYLATYLYNLKLAQRKDKLDRINRQLKEFYGPLFALVRASSMAWAAFRSLHKPGGAFFSKESPPTDEEAAAYRLWMSEVFMPLNLRIEKLIIENADLLEEPNIPDCLLVFCAHVSAYKGVIKQWEAGDFSSHSSVVNYPGKELMTYTESSYVLLKEKQARLLTLISKSSSKGPFDQGVKRLPSIRKK